MTRISPADIDQAAQQLTGRHHPHYQGTTKTDFGHVRFDFKPFTGTEAEPALPAGFRCDESLSDRARKILATEYEAARTLWLDARYIQALKAATADAATLWAAYVTGRQEMDQVFASIGSAPDTHWRSTVSRLVAAHEKTLAAARTWDETGQRIAKVHAEFVYSNLTHDDAHRRAGVDVTDWIVGTDSDYGPYREGLLTRKVTGTVKEQCEHLRKVATLTGDHA